MLNVTRADVLKSTSRLPIEAGSGVEYQQVRQPICQGITLDKLAKLAPQIVLF